MSGGVLKGPLSLLLVGGALLLAYKYVPFGDIVDRFQQRGDTVGTAAPSSGPLVASPPLSGSTAPSVPLDEPVRAATGDRVTQPPSGRAELPAKPPQPVLVQDEAAQPGPGEDAVLGQFAGLAGGSGVAPGDIQLVPGDGTVALTGGSGVQVGVEAGALPISVTGIAVTVPTAVRDGETAPAVETGPAATVTETVAKPAPRVPVAIPAAEQPVLAPKPTVAPKPVVVVPQPKPKPKPEIVARVERPVVAPKPLPRPEPAAKAPELRILVEADVHERAGTAKYGAQAYTERLRKELLAVAGDYLGQANVAQGDANLAFRDDLDEGRPGIERLCQRADAKRLLLADMSVPSAGFSTVPSAYWPEIEFTAINCGDGRLHKSPKKRLEPHRLDGFEYQQDFARRSQDFVASQGYFLKP